jgi:hypothetical protein
VEADVHHLVVDKFGKKPLVNEQLKSYLERPNLKLNVVKFKEQFEVEITGRSAALKNLEV